MTKHAKPSRKKWQIIAGIVLVFVCLLVIVGKYAMRQAWLWAYQIRAYERADAQRQPPKGGILFVGSSSIRYWKTVQQDMAPLPVLNRGFGGAHIPHITHYAPRIITPYKPRIIVLYAGENDLASGVSLAQTTAALDTLLDHIHRTLPSTHIAYLSIKPSVLRSSRWPIMKTFNQHIKTHLINRRYVTYVDITKGMLDTSGKAKPALFSWDRLHMNANGYRLWTTTLKPILTRNWNQLNKPAPTIR